MKMEKQHRLPLVYVSVLNLFKNINNMCNS